MSFVVKVLLGGIAIWIGLSIAIQIVFGIPIAGYKLGVYLGPNHYAKKGWNIDYKNGKYEVVYPRAETDISVDWGKIDTQKDPQRLFRVYEDSTRIASDWKTPTKSGYQFDGLWKDGVLYVNRDGYIVRRLPAGELSLQAKWVAVPADGSGS
ncbi:MAG: hypothetical protein E7637_02895 [Ruminococcaceae bacterium]|nr:hypothetical protein [Oscillospiraceae bacterium]